VIERFARFPAALASQARSVKIGNVPVLLAHPDWVNPAPVVLWLHGRTVNKELDPGRYLRWIRAGIAACAIDLPGHGEREDASLQSAARSLEVLARVLPEIDHVVHELGDARWGGVFDQDRLGLGGMSAGGMAALRRLCDPHRFRCAAVEGTSGDLGALHGAREAGVRWEDERLREELDPIRHLEGWRPLPLLVLHSEADRVVPFACMRGFIERLREHYRAQGANAGMIEFATWPDTGAPDEHLGFGRFSNDAKNMQTAFFQRCFGMV
jgi:alpha-beta hydrolase superfamily lysophospholipase